MELAQAKIPYLPPDWTLARAAKYAAKLGVFILVPGLHQIACKRRILGGLLLVLYFAAEFSYEQNPFDSSMEYFTISKSSWKISESLQFIAWLLLALDLRNLEDRKLKLNLFFVLFCVIGIYYGPYHYIVPYKWFNVVNVHVVQESYVCPVYCKYDIVEYKISLSKRQEIVAGDHILAEYLHGRRYLTKVLVDSPDETCTENPRTHLNLPVDNYYCQNDLGPRRNEFMILGGPEPDYKTADGRDVSVTSRFAVVGVDLKIIGNTREYIVFSDGITDIVGNALLVVYKWTGFNLFGLSN